MARVISRRAWSAVAAGMAVALVFVLMLAGGEAGAQSSPVVNSPGTINGSPIRVGTRLTATGGSWGGPQGTTARWEWFACPANARSWYQCFQRQLYQNNYTIQSGDVGRYIVLNLYAYRGQPQNPGTSGRAERFSITSSTVAPAATPTPAPTPVPTPRPTVVPTATRPRRRPRPTPPPIFEVAPTLVPTSGEVLQETSRKRRIIRPFPVVRMRGALTATGEDHALLGACPAQGVDPVRCKGRSCPASSWSRAWNLRKKTLTRMGRFERSLRAGVKITVQVTRKGYVGQAHNLRDPPRRRADRARIDACRPRAA